VCAAHVVDRGLVAGCDDATARARVRDLLAGNICRCTGYQLIVDAVIAAAREVAPEVAIEAAPEVAPDAALDAAPGRAR
jgi:xanthine dehydrogenase iron-sulfur cluster and FAD-binding subunit A